MSEKRVFRSRTRASGMRDARLIIIAAEGTRTEKCYFEDLANVYHNSKIHVEVLDRISTSSSPEHVLKQLDTFKTNYRIRAGYDELWMVIDIDRWKVETLAEVCRQAIQKRYDLAISNPCFEIWLLMHHRSPREYSEQECKRLQENRKDGTNRTYLERELIGILGRYNKENPATEDFIPYIQQAIERAREIDIHPEDRWPNDIGSRVYQLALRIIFSK